LTVKDGVVKLVKRALPGCPCEPCSRDRIRAAAIEDLELDMEEEVLDHPDHWDEDDNNPSMQRFDISHEVERTYTYRSDIGKGYEITIECPLELYISESGTHRVWNGACVAYLPAGWIMVTWVPEDPSNPVAF